MGVTEPDTPNIVNTRAPSQADAGPPEPRNISESTFQQIRELIVHGQLAPGSRVVEADLAERLRVSRTPVRSALHRLEQQGYIRILSGRGSKAKLAIAPLTQDDARELYDVVGHLEGLAARSTAQLDAESRGPVLRRLKELNARLGELAAAGRANSSTIFEVDITFHQTIIDAGAGPRLRALHAAVKPQTERYWRLYASSILEQLSLSVGEHVMIIEALERGDADAAERAVLSNWQQGAKRLAGVIETLGERGSW